MEDLDKSTISFTAIAGDESVAAVTWSYINGEFGLFDLLDNHVPKNKYGKDLNLVLIALFIEGRENWFDMPKDAKSRRYSTKDKSTQYDVPIKKDNFFCLTQIDRKEFIIKQVMDAIRAAQIIFEKKGLQADFTALRTDFEKVADIYRARSLPKA